MLVARYNSDGTLDTDFGTTTPATDGYTKINIGWNNDGANTIALQPDGKIIIGGYAITGTNWDFALVRLHSDGTLDTSFKL